MFFYRVIRNLPALLPAALLPLLLASCKSIEMPKVPGITPYRMVIQQGNFISQEMVAQLKPGMTKEQVRFILGTPLVTDIFHADRWDYVFYRVMSDGKREQRNLSVVFEKDKLARVIGDLMPADAAATQSTGFDPLVKPAAVPATKPAAEAPKPVAEPVKPAAEVSRPAESWEPTKQNWGTDSAAPEKKPEPVASEDAKKAEKDKPVQETTEPGFFGRMLDKIGL